MPLDDIKATPSTYRSLLTQSKMRSSINHSILTYCSKAVQSHSPGPPASLSFESHPAADLVRQPPSPEALPTQLPRLPCPHLQADPASNKPLLECPDAGFDSPLLTHDVVELLAHHRRRRKHLVDIGD